MLCPIDQTTLQITERQGIEIDYCPKCRGVWLDRGELDKLIERSAEQSYAASQRDAAPERRYDDRATAASGLDRMKDAFRGRDRDRDDDDDYRYDKHGRRKKKRESFLDDLFDF